MTERSTKIYIGSFVIGAVALMITFILLLGSGTLGSKNPTFVLNFTTSLKGLTQGSPVYFKGIRIGKVTSIQIRPELNGSKFYTPVFIEIEKNKATSLLEGGEEGELFEDPRALRNLIEHGLRAQLGISSILTGQLCVELDMFPNASPVNLADLPPFRGFPQIPTQLSSIDAALNTLENIPIQEVMLDMMGALKSVSEQFQALDMSGLAASIRDTSDSIREQMNRLNPLFDSADKVLNAYTNLAAATGKDIHMVMNQAGRTLNTVDTLAKNSSGMVAEAETAIRSIRRSADTASSLLSEDSAPVLEFSQTLLALRQAAQSLSELAALLEIKPNALIFGRNQ